MKCIVSGPLLIATPGRGAPRLAYSVTLDELVAAFQKLNGTVEEERAVNTRECEALRAQRSVFAASSSVRSWVRSSVGVNGLVMWGHFTSPTREGA